MDAKPNTYERDNVCGLVGRRDAETKLMLTRLWWYQNMSSERNVTRNSQAVRWFAIITYVTQLSQPTLVTRGAVTILNSAFLDNVQVC